MQVAGMQIPGRGNEILSGRSRIFTDEKVVDESNLIDVLANAYTKHCNNVEEIEYLLKYESGHHPMIMNRVKEIRPEVDYRVVDNVAHYVTRFHIGYFWGTPAMYIQRGNEDIHQTPSEVDDEGIAGLNEMLRNGEGISAKRQHIGSFVEKTGIGYSMVDIKSADEFDEDFILIRHHRQKKDEYVGSLCHVYDLDPRYTFCVYHNGVGKRKVLGVTYVRKQSGETVFTCYTDKKVFEVRRGEIMNANPTTQVNLLGKIPIVEWNRDVDITGCFEHVIPDMDALDILTSDFANNSTQRTQDIWWGHNIALPQDENGNDITPESGEWVLTTTPQGLNERASDAKIAPLASTYDSVSAQSQMSKRFNHILQKCYVPIQTESSGGGSTGTAMDMSAGWSAAELDALEEQNTIEAAVREELNLILLAIKFVPEQYLPVDNPIRQIHSADIDIHFSRRRNYDLSIKANTFATLLSRGVHGRHALKVTELFEDNEQVWRDSQEMIEAYQTRQCKGEPGEQYGTSSSSGDVKDIGDNDRILQDSSDQTSNSPIVGGFTE